MTIEQELSSLLEAIEETSGLVWASEGTAIVHDPDIGVYRGHVADCVEEDDAKAIVQTVEFIRAHGPALLTALADQRRMREAATGDFHIDWFSPAFCSATIRCESPSPDNQRSWGHMIEGQRVAIVPIDPEGGHVEG